jgi:hypothetical protein
MIQEMRSCDHKPGSAEPALDGLLVDEGLLDTVQGTRLGQVFNGRNGLTGNFSQGDFAGRAAFVIDQYHTCPALLQPTSELRSDQSEIIAQDIQEGGIGIGVEGKGLIVNEEGDWVGHGLP